MFAMFSLSEKVKWFLAQQKLSPAVLNQVDYACKFRLSLVLAVA